MVNITSELWKKAEFADVKYLKARVKAIERGEYNSKVTINNSMPKTFKFSKKLAEYRHPNTFKLNEHLMNIAGMQRRIACQGDWVNRKQNPFDPVSHPSLFFRRDG